MNGNVALIGCGAIAQNFYLPAFAKLRAHFDRLWLVDPSDKALATAASMVQADRAHQLGDIDEDIHFVVIATPNHLHFPLACEALSRGAHVLIEKPFVIWPDEGRTLVKTAAEEKRVVAINQTRRFFPLTCTLRRQIQDGVFGSLKSVTHREGTRLLWPFESGAAFARGANRTGVIIDFGVHVLDFYQYLFQPEWTFVSALHDGFAGPEGLAEIELLANGAPVSIRLSRYHDQENIAHLVFEQAQVNFNVYDSATYSVRWNTGRPARMHDNRNGAGGYCSFAEEVLLNFLAASDGRELVVCDPASSMPVIELLDEIYRLAGQYSAKIGAA